MDSELCLYGYTSLTKVTLPNSIIGIGRYAFAKCTSLQEINLPGTISEIGNGAFAGCSSLKKISIPDLLNEVSDSLFAECEVLEGAIQIPQSVTRIGNNSFYCCRKITGINIPSKVEAIGDSAFWGDWALADIEIEDGVKRIGTESFYACWALKTITLPASITTIDANAFGWCYALTGVSSYNTTPPAAASSAFGFNQAYYALKVTEGSGDAYREADVWKDFNKIDDVLVTAIDGIEADRYTIRSENSAIIVEGAERPVEVYNIGGIQVYHGTDSRIDNLSRGVYVVKIENRRIKIFVP